MPRLLLLGGPSTAYHNISEIGPGIVKALAPAGFELVTTEDMDDLNAGNLKQYAGVFNYTTDRDITEPQWQALLAFVRGGGAYIGIHNATDTFENKEEALRLIGGHFITHPAMLDVDVEIVGTEHEITRGVEPFTIFEELYIMEHWPEDYHLLAETHSHDRQPLAWIREEGEGRVFYFSLGHNLHCFDHPQYVKLLGRGAQWATKQPVTA
ncbi:MAG TPA: ThuA domain-containing protein [Armatimonadota bacterium]